MSKYVLLYIGIACCFIDAFITQETVISWVGLACVIVELRIIWETTSKGGD